MLKLNPGGADNWISHVITYVKTMFSFSISLGGIAEDDQPA